MAQAEQTYVDSLVAYVGTHGTCSLSHIGSDVPKPSGFVGSLKSLLIRRAEFILHDPQLGGGGETVSLAPEVAADMEMKDYCQQLLDQVIECGGEIFLSTLGGLVRRPSHFSQQLKSIIESRTDMFTLERGAGNAWIVRGVSSEPEPDPELATVEQVSRAFYDYLMDNASLRQRCQKRSEFTKAYNEWCEYHRTQGRQMAKTPPGAILFTLSRQLKLIQISIDTILFKPSGVNAVFERLRERREQLEADKHGVTVRPEKVLFDRVIARGATEARDIVISTSLSGLSLQSFALMREDFFSCSFSASSPTPLPQALRPGRPTSSIRLSFKPNVEGMAGDVLTLWFETASGRRFSICRFVEGRCGDADLHDDLKPSAPYQKPKRRRRPREEREGEEILVPPEPDASRAPQAAAGGGGMRLARHEVNQSWKKLVIEDAKAAAVALEQGQQKVKEATSAECMRVYRQHFEKLLWTEEIQLHADLTSFDLVEEKSTPLQRVGSEYLLVVRGLAEKRPSVLRGDTVWITLPDGSGRRWQGKAIDIRREEVALHVHPNFARSYIDGMRVEVRFVLGRRPLRIFYQGLTLVHQLGEPTLFPEPRHVLESPASSDRIPASDRKRVADELRILNYNVRANDEQVAAVRAIVRGEARQVPYVIFGPPGTGKTTTVVEAVLQFVKAFPASRVLVCAPTNTAADVCCEKLGQHGAIAGRAEMLRLVSYTRNRSEVPEGVRPFTQPYDSERRCYPEVDAKEVLTKRIVIVTLSMGGSLCNLGVSRGDFDLIVIDEAGQAMEPEAMAPVASLLAPEGQLVLAGDDKQLGPVIHHDHAKAYGLQTSFLERLMSRKVYARGEDGYDGRVLTKLVRNFRSHEALLELPNELFYNGDLIACADPILRNSCLQWEGLPNACVPMLFHGIEGRDDREGNSPSWFNADEAIQILRYIESLLRMRQNPLQQADIGVITPYNKQMQKISKLLKGQDLGGVKVGSTELFQGQERRVILISTVRSSADFIGFDAKHKLGFLDNPKRFNVAATRACSLMIIVGNPAVLAPDPNWGRLLRACIDKGAYTGVLPPPSAGGGGDVGGDGGGDDLGGDGKELLADRLEKIMDGADEAELDVSQQLQQAGGEMPSWGQN